MTSKLCYWWWLLWNPFPRTFDYQITGRSSCRR